MTRTPSDACFFVGLMSLTVAAGAWLYGDSTWFTAGLVVAVIATVTWAITHRHETQPIPYTTTVRYDINELFNAINTQWEQRARRDITISTTNKLTPEELKRLQDAWEECRPNMTPHQADTNWPADDHQAIWPQDAGAPE